MLAIQEPRSLSFLFCLPAAFISIEWTPSRCQEKEREEIKPSFGDSILWSGHPGENQTKSFDYHGHKYFLAKKNLYKESLN